MRTLALTHNNTTFDRRTYSITHLMKLVLKLTRFTSCSAFLFPVVSLAANHQAINNWQGGSDIMVDAFSNSMMPSTPAGFEASPLNSSPINNTENENTTSCIDTNANCNAIKHQDSLSYKKVILSTASYWRLTVTNTVFNSKSMKLSYQFLLFLPFKQTKGDYLQGLVSKQIIRNHVDHFLYTPDFEETNLPQFSSKTANAKTVWTSRLNQSFSSTNIELNFSDKNFADFNTGFSEKANEMKGTQPDVQITQKTSIEAAADSSGPKLLSHSIGEDNSGVDDITWLNDNNTPADSGSVSNISGQEVTLSYQPIDNFNPEAGPKESIEQNLPHQTNPFIWKPSTQIDFNSQSPF